MFEETQDQQPNTLTDMIEVNLPLNRLPPSISKGRWIHAHTIGNDTQEDPKEDFEVFRGGTDDEQNCNLLVEAINGAPRNEKVTVTPALFQKAKIHPARRKTASNSNIPPNSKKPQ